MTRTPVPCTGRRACTEGSDLRGNARVLTTEPSLHHFRRGPRRLRGWVNLAGFRFAVVTSLLAAVMGFVPGARADTPACDAIVNDPTIATCTCICEADSQFSGCIGLSEGTEAPTPGQCPDMLQGRRVLSAGDALATADPVIAGSGTNARVYVFQTENDPNNAGLGIVGNKGTAVWTVKEQVPCQLTSEAFPQQTRFARLFDLPYAVTITLRPSTSASDVTSSCSSNADASNFVLEISSPNAGAPSVPAYAWQANKEWVQLAVADFNYDGYDDLVFLNLDAIQAFTAVDPTDPTKGITRLGGADTKLPSGAYRAPINTPAVGDFNGDGLLDVAWIGGDFPNRTGTLSVFFATVCPGPVAETICDGASPFQVILDPASKLFPSVTGASSTIALANATLTPTQCGLVEPGKAQTNAQDSLRAGAVTLGNFEANGYNPRGAPIDELVVAYVSGTDAASSSSQCSVDVQYWSFSSPDSSSPVWAKQRGTTASNLFPQLNDNPLDLGATYALYAQSAYLDWYGTVEQAVIGVTGQLPTTGTFSFPVTATISGTGSQAEPSVCAAQAGSGDGQFPYAWGLAVGRFSTSTTVNPNNPSACGDFADAAPGDCPYNPQIAMLIASDQKSPFVAPVRIPLWAVQASDPAGSNANLKCANDGSVAGYLPVLTQTDGISAYDKPYVTLLRAGSLLQAGDAFGNSVRVGEPTVTRISEHTQPQIIIQAPPSLIDFVQPNTQDSSTPAIVNFTRAPNNYQAQFQFGTTSSNTASTQQTHSFTSSTTETVAGEIKFPQSVVGTVDIKNKESWSQFNQNTNNEQLGTYSTTRLQTGGAIGADDQVWWTQTTFNVFHFPVLGMTSCPASTTCDASDPNATGCTAAASGVALTCASSGAGCHCLSAGAPDSLCPGFPSAADARSCAEQGGDVCCSLLPQQLNVSFSGPEEVTRSSSPGASIEWYQPRHEPAQILSYPSKTPLIQQRNPGSQALANLDPFSTGTNDPSESISWTCGTTSDVSTGTTTTHSFDTDTSITIGMNNINVKPIGANLSFGFDYQGSGSLSTLNSYSVGQTASSSIGLLLQGAGFFNSDQYAYSVAGIVLGATKPQSVLDNPDLKVCPQDNPDCSTVDQVQADCTTTGPITVAFAADPTTDVSGVWWSSTSPYLGNVDVALNNPSRWRRVTASQVADSSLQCRGPANTPVCYTSNQPPTANGAADVWDALFYSMKGLLVTNGGTAGPLRNSAAVGDQIYLQARVYNYSLKKMDTGTRVYARFYRQQLDVNDDNGALSVVAYAQDASGNPLPAVPIGPTGLGDGAPIPVISPTGDGSATIPPFNNTSDPSQDNIALATTSYVAATGDACEYDNGVQSCNGAYYAYWVTVWAEDANGNLVSELPAHGLGASFDRNTRYAFITDVPLETTSFAGATDSFSNNVGMFKMVFSIVPADTSGTLTAVRPGPLTLDRFNVSRDKTVLGEPVVVSAQVVSGGASAPGATVVFSDGDPQNGGQPFDAEWLPLIRALDRHFVHVSYNPETCGRHEIYAEVTGGARSRAREVTLIDVGIDFKAAIRYLIEQVKRLATNVPGNGGPSHRHQPFGGWMQVADNGDHGGAHVARHDDHRDLHRHKGGLDAEHRRRLTRELEQARQALAARRTHQGIRHLQTFIAGIRAHQRRGRIDTEQAEALIAQSDQIIGCVR